MDGAWSRTRLLRSLGDWTGTGADPLFRSLADRLRAQIRAGQIPAGVQLPSERALASALGVSRSTVVAAFTELRADGLLTSRQGSGTRVTRAGVHRFARGESRLESFAQPQSGWGRIDLRSAALPGLPMVSEAIADLSSSDLVAGLVESHGYAPNGLPLLREAVATYYGELGLPTTTDQLLITSGAQQALRLIASTLLEPGALAVVEEPTFRGGIETLRAAGAELVGVPSGADGIDLGALARLLETTAPRMVFVQASGHNPVGSVLAARRRSELAALCARHGTMLVEDAAVLDASIDLAPLAPISGPGSVVTIGSASKSFWGGLRVGWLRGDPGLVEHLASAKGSEDLGTSVIAQLLTATLLGRIDEAREARRAALSSARATMLEALDRELPDWGVVVPRVGASLWARIPHGSATAFSQYAARQGVLVLPGPTFSARDALDDHVRLAYADPSAIVEGVAALGRLWRRFGV